MLTSSVILPLFGLVLPATAGPSDPDFYNTVANIYSGDGCAESSLVWADPIFGRGGHCQPLDRNNNTPDILSYMVTYNFPECHGKYEVGFLKSSRAMMRELQAGQSLMQRPQSHSVRRR